MPPIPAPAATGQPRPGSAWDPWFGRHPRVALAVVAALYVAVFALGLLAGHGDSAVTASAMLYVLPVALAATAFGRTAGIIAGVVAVVLVVAGALIVAAPFGPVAWVACTVPLLLLGYLLGSAMDRLRLAETERRALEIAALLHREAIEINDSLVQRMTVAKWTIEAGQVEATERLLAEAMTEGQRLVSDLITRAGMGERAEVLGQAAPSSAEAQDDTEVSATPVSPRVA